VSYKLTAIILSALAISQVAFAQDDDVRPTSNGKTYQELQQEIIQLKRADQVRDTVIKNLIRRIEELERLSSSSKEIEQPVTPEKESLQVQVDPEVEARMKKEGEENYKLIQSAFEQRLGKEGSMLLPPWQLIYEPSFSYAHSSYDRIVVDGFTIFPILVVGDIVSERVRWDIVTNNNSFRLGLPYDTQFDIVVPLGYQRERTFRADGDYENEETSGLGDISLGLSHQLAQSHNFWPDTLAGIHWKSTTGEDPYRLVTVDEPSLGTGFQTWGASLTSAFNADPVVLYAGLSGTYTPSDDKDIGEVDPGESLGANLGMALALNFDTALSFNYQYRYTFETELEGEKIKGSDLTTSTFTIGMSKAKSDWFAFDIDLGIGLTQDSPDYQFAVSLPFEFSLKDVQE